MATSVAVTPGTVSTAIIARACAATVRSRLVSVPSPFWNRTCARAGWVVALRSAISVSKKAPVAPSAKKRRKVPAAAAPATNDTSSWSLESATVRLGGANVTPSRSAATVALPLAGTPAKR